MVDVQTEARAIAPDRKHYEAADKIWRLSVVECKHAIATALAAKDAELAAVKENCETVCNSYADENQRLYDRAKRAESLLAEAIDLLGSSLCEMAPASAENHKRRVIEFIAARRVLEAQGG